MTDVEALENAEKISRRMNIPIVHIPDDVCKQIITVNFLDRDNPKITRKSIRCPQS